MRRNEYDIFYPKASSLVALEEHPPLKKFFDKCIRDFSSSDLSRTPFRKRLKSTRGTDIILAVDLLANDEKKEIYATAWTEEVSRK